MGNRRGNAYGLTILSPILPGLCDSNLDSNESRRSHSAKLRDYLENLASYENSPLAKVPNTYLARLYVLNDVYYQGKPATYEHLQSKYLVFESNFHGELEPYLEGMWQGMEDEIVEIWSHCIGFESVRNSTSFIDYIKKCQLETTFFFMGSTNVSQAEQLKALYLKQEFSKFVFDNQGINAQELQTTFSKFIERVQPTNLAGPTWRAGVSNLKKRCDWS